MKGENSWRKSSQLVQKAGCIGCNMAKQEIRDRRGEIIKVIKETCRFGGEVAREKGSVVKFSCYQ